MSGKRALIVDDSRSARAFLTRILERYDIQVDDAGSAEEAIEYLTRHRPDVIFMDHLMPGMDGFQAVAAIKNDPRTATIPILMYTSQEGELYLSQARALGALGVLPKQTKPADVSRALEQLHLLPTREVRTVDEAAAATSGSYATATDAFPTGTFTAVAVPPEPALTPQLRAQLEAVLREHGSELRRFVTQSLEHHTGRILAEVRTLLDDAATANVTGSPEAEPPVAAPDGAGRAVLWLSAIAALTAAVAGVLWYRAYNDERQGATRATAPPPAAAASAARLPEPPARSAAGAPAAAPLLVETVPFGESPLGGARVERVQALLERLQAGGFRGTVEIRTYPGRFCLQAAGETVALASADSSFAKCDLIGNPIDSGATASHESVPFANMLATQRGRSAGTIDVVLATGGGDELQMPYPPTAETLTAGEWNRAAAANNRVEVRARAAP